jgi:hypothetical protein
MSLRRPRRLHVENLEGRITPAVSVRLLPGLLIIRGDNAANTLSITEVGANKFKVENNAKAVGTFTFSNLQVTMGNRNDIVSLKVTTALTGRVLVSLGNGSDTFSTKLSTVGARIGGDVLVNTGLPAQRPAPLPLLDYDEIVELYNLRFGGRTTVIGAPGSGTSLIDTEAGKFGGPVTIVNSSTITLGNTGDPARFTTMSSSLSIANVQKNTDSRTDQSAGPGNGLYLFGGSEIFGNVSYSGGNGIDQVFLPSGPSNGAGVTIGGNVSASLGNGINTLQLGNAAFGADVGGNVTYSAGSNDDRLLFDSGSVVNGSLFASLGEGNNQLFGDSLGLGQSGAMFNPTGTAAVGGNMTIVLGNGNNFIGTYGIDPTSSLSVGGNLTFLVGNGDNLGGDAFAPGAIQFFNTAVSVGGVATYRAGTGTNNLDITNETISVLRLLFSGGPTDLQFNQLSGVFNGDVFIDFGTGFGPKNLGGTAAFGGNVTILNY